MTEQREAALRLRPLQVDRTGEKRGKFMLEVEGWKKTTRWR